MRKYTTAPHPFIIEPSEDSKTVFEPGEMLSFGLVLIGKAIDSLPYFIYTFEELGNTGIGKGRGRYILDEVFTGNDSSESIYSARDKKFKGPVQSLTITGAEGADGHGVSLSFLTPTRIVYDGHLTDEPEFHILIRNLLRRIAHLTYFHCGGDTSEFDFKGFINRATAVSVKEKNIEWHDWERYSARQDTRMKLGGFVGDITFEGDLSEYIPYIKAGEIVHIGKGTSFGLGRYKILQS